jgi:hypothetical protein
MNVFVMAVRLSTSTNDENIELVSIVVQVGLLNNIQEISREVGLSVGSCHSSFCKNLNMSCLCQHLVPIMLTPENIET